MKISIQALGLAAALSVSACRPEVPHPPLPEGERDIVIGRSFLLESEVFGSSRTVNVYLPAGYEDSGDDYPVLYLVDGGVDQDFHPMSGMAALAGLTGQFRELILVGVRTEARRYELTAPSEEPQDLELIPDNGGAADFRRHLLEEVKPWVEARYRASGEDGIIGESLAGLFITETFLRAPGSFTHFVAVSPSLWWRDGALSREAEKLLQGGPDSSGRSFFLTIADEGGTMLEAVERVAAALEGHAPEGLRWWYEPMPEESHSTIYNPATLRALRRIFAPREPPSDGG